MSAFEPSLQIPQHAAAIIDAPRRVEHVPETGYSTDPLPPRSPRKWGRAVAAIAGVAGIAAGGVLALGGKESSESVISDEPSVSTPSNEVLDTTPDAPVTVPAQAEQTEEESIYGSVLSAVESALEAGSPVATVNGLVMAVDYSPESVGRVYERVVVNPYLVVVRDDGQPDLDFGSDDRNNPGRTFMVFNNLEGELETIETTRARFQFFVRPEEYAAGLNMLNFIGNAVANPEGGYIWTSSVDQSTHMVGPQYEVEIPELRSINNDPSLVNQIVSENGFYPENLTN